MRMPLLIPVLGLVIFTSAASAQTESAVRNQLASRAPLSTVLAFVGSGKNVALTRLDGKTLAPLSGMKRLRVGTFADTWAFSRDRSRLALLAREAGLLIVDPVRLRVVRRLTGKSYRFGEEVGPWDLAWAGRSTLVVIADCFCAKGSLAYVWVDLPGPHDPGGISTSIELYEPAIITWERTPEGFAVLGNPEGDPSLLGLDLLHARGSDNLVLGQLTAGSAALAVDAGRDRLFVVPASGGAAEVGHLARRRTVSHHDLTLPPPLSGSALNRSAAWLGSDTLALWGVDGDRTSPTPAGLMLIDTSDWTARMVDPAITSAVGASGVVLAWAANSAAGVVAYAPTGRTRFRALAGHVVRAATASVRYAYVSADCTKPTGTESCSLFSVDLRTGQVTGPLRSSATPVVP